MMTTTIDDSAIERIARALAAQSGQDYDRLDYYPGYARGRWRDEARAFIARSGAMPVGRRSAEDRGY